MVKVLTAADIIAANDRKRELVEIPEWGGSVYVQEISAADAEAIAENASVVEFCAMCICDEKGKLLFSKDQVEELGKKSPKALEKVMRAITGINEALVEEGKA
jgi:hypothetical protein